MSGPTLPPGLDSDDYEVSATIRTLGELDAVLDHAMSLRGGAHPKRLVDLGCGIGGLTRYVGMKVGAHEMIGIDRDPARLARAAAKGLQTVEADLNALELDLDDASVGLVLSFGSLEHVVWYDSLLRESARVLEDGAPLIIAVPNLGSYVNRIALLLGFQPREVEVSWELSAGLLPLYRRTKERGAPLGHVHAVTLRCMRELLPYFDFEVIKVVPLSPDFGTSFVRLADRCFGRFPSLSRRFMVLARRRPRLAGT